MNFLEAQKPLIVVLKCLGFFGFKFGSDYSDVMSSHLSFLYSIVLIVFGHIFITFIHVKFVASAGNYLSDNNPVTQFVTILEGCTVLISCLIMLFSIFFHRKAQIKFATGILKLEREIRTLKFTRRDYNERLRKKTIKLVVGGLFIHILFTLCYLFLFPKEIFFVFMLETVNYIMYAMFLTFTVIFIQGLVDTMGHLFDELDYNLKHFISPCPFHFHNKHLKQIFKHHDELLELIGEFNESFGIVYLGNFIFIFGIASFEIYFAYGAFVEGNTSPNLIMNILSFMPHFAAISSVGFSCESVMEKVNNLLLKLHNDALNMLFRLRALACT